MKTYDALLETLNQLDKLTNGLQRLADEVYDEKDLKGGYEKELLQYQHQLLNSSIDYITKATQNIFYLLINE